MLTAFDLSFDLTTNMLPGGVAPEDAIERLRDDLEVLPGAGWVSVAWCGHVPADLEAIRIFEPGNCIPLLGPESDLLKRQVAEIARLSLDDERIR